MIEMSASAARSWLTLSQAALSLGVVAVALGALGVMRLSGQIHRATPQATGASASATSAASPAISARLTALETENEALRAQLAAADKSLDAAHKSLAAEESRAATLTASQPRVMSDAQAAKLTAAFKAIPGPPRVNIQTLADPEAAGYGASLVRVIEAAGFRGQTETIHPDPAPRGVILALKAGSPQASAIRYAFEALHIPVHASTAETGTFDAIITVGLKP